MVCSVEWEVGMQVLSMIEVEERMFTRVLRKVFGALT